MVIEVNVHKYAVLLWTRITTRMETVVRTGQQRTKKTFLLILYICRDEDVASVKARAWFKMVVPAGMVIRMRVYPRTRGSKDSRGLPRMNVWTRMRMMLRMVGVYHG